MELNYELNKLNLYQLVIGCDEVGRGPLAGPVVAGAVALDKNITKLRSTFKLWNLVIDSKKLSPKKRDLVAAELRATFKWAITEIDVSIIEEINILQASLLAMSKASQALAKDNPSVFLVLDGNKLIPNCVFPQEAVIGGDGQIFAIAAASIIAKVHRDNLMTKFDDLYPGYDFAKHKGYGTLNHRQAIAKLGLSPIHRPSFCHHFSIKKA